MEKFHIADVDNLYAKMPVIESARAKLVTESYKETEDEPIITRRAKAFAHILHNIPIIIRDEELIVGSSTLAPRGCQTFPEYSFQWLEDELDTVATRTADPFYISEETKADLRKFWQLVMRVSLPKHRKNWMKVMWEMVIMRRSHVSWKQ